MFQNITFFIATRGDVTFWPTSLSFPLLPNEIRMKSLSLDSSKETNQTPVAATMDFKDRKLYCLSLMWHVSANWYGQTKKSN